METIRGIGKFISVSYYRYKILSALYMLDPVEQGIINFLVLLFGYFLFRYIFSFVNLALRSDLK